MHSYDILNAKETLHHVAFKGRTGGWGFGEVNGAESILNLFTDCGIATKYERSDPVHFWAITPRRPSYDVCTGGDSGSIVVLDNGESRNGH
jgi:hypothetical protein